MMHETDGFWIRLHCAMLILDVIEHADGDVSGGIFVPSPSTFNFFIFVLCCRTAFSLRFLPLSSS